MSEFPVNRIDFEDEQGAGVGLSSKKFGVIIRNHLALIVEAEQSLQSAYILFSQERYVQPVQYRVAVDSLERLKADLQQFSSVAERLAPADFISVGYKLLVTLRSLEDQVSNLMLLLKDYHAVCMTSSLRAYRYHQDICNSFEMLLEHLTKYLAGLSNGINMPSPHDLLRKEPSW